MGAGTLQKGALGQQLAASGQARRAEALSRKKTGRGPVGKGRARAVIEDRMDQNDREGKQKQGKGGRPGRPIDGRPPVMKPIEEGGRPFPPKEDRPTIDPPKGDRPPRTVPPRDDIVRPLPYFPPKGDRPIRGKDQFGPGDIPGRPPFGGKKGPRRGGTEFGPGRGSRIPEGQAGLFGKIGGASGLQDFLARMAQLRGGGMK